jgi:hypothetical protein
MRYLAQAPSTTDARLVADRIVTATFRVRNARHLREGSQAIVTFGNSVGERLSGTVQSLQTQDWQATAVIILNKVPGHANLQSRCDVTVDTSVNSKALKID